MSRPASQTDDGPRGRRSGKIGFREESKALDLSMGSHRRIMSVGGEKERGTGRALSWPPRCRVAGTRRLDIGISTIDEIEQKDRDQGADADAAASHLITKEIPRLCRGGSKSLTIPGVAGLGAGRLLTTLRTGSQAANGIPFDGRRRPRGIDLPKNSVPCDHAPMSEPQFGRRPPSGGSPIGSAQRPRYRFERPRS
jgi:hypothetical protein